MSRLCVQFVCRTFIFFLLFSAELSLDIVEHLSFLYITYVTFEIFVQICHSCFVLWTLKFENICHPHMVCTFVKSCWLVLFWLLTWANTSRIPLVCFHKHICHQLTALSSIRQQVWTNIFHHVISTVVMNKYLLLPGCRVSWLVTCLSMLIISMLQDFPLNSLCI